MVILISVQDNLISLWALMDPTLFIETLLESIGALECWSKVPCPACTAFANADSKLKQHRWFILDKGGLYSYLH